MIVRYKPRDDRIGPTFANKKVSYGGGKRDGLQQTRREGGDLDSDSGCVRVASRTQGRGQTPEIHCNILYTDVQFICMSQYIHPNFHSFSLWHADPRTTFVVARLAKASRSRSMLCKPWVHVNWEPF